jgi:hypothetical protein
MNLFLANHDSRKKITCYNQNCKNFNQIDINLSFRAVHLRLADVDSVGEDLNASEVRANWREHTTKRGSQRSIKRRPQKYLIGRC